AASASRAASRRTGSALQLASEQRHRRRAEPAHEPRQVRSVAASSISAGREPVRELSQVSKHRLVHWPYHRCIVTQSSTTDQLVTRCFRPCRSQQLTHRWRGKTPPADGCTFRKSRHFRRKTRCDRG